MPSRAVCRPSELAADRLESRRRLLAEIAMNRRKADGGDVGLEPRAAELGRAAFGPSRHFASPPELDR